MEKEFWLERWSRNEIHFHLDHVNPLLRRHWPQLALEPGVPVFVPLCGKSLDLQWLAGAGHPVVGVELAEAAVRDFFTEAGLSSRIERGLRLPAHSAGIVRLYCGDLFELTALELRGVAAVYDRAALVALPPRSRAAYVDHLLRIVPEGARMLLITLEYEQTLVAGPPHAVLETEVRALYEPRCEVELLDREAVAALPPSFAAAGVAAAAQAIYRITKRT